MRRKRLAVIRGPRESNMLFYSMFEKLYINYIAASYSPIQDYKAVNKNFEWHNLLMYQPFKFDPLAFFPQNKNLSWSYIQDLEKYIRECDAVCISDTYYFMNLQAVQLANKYNIPIITIIWTTIPNHITSWFPPYSWITKKVVNATDLFILRSKTALRFTDSLCIPREKTTVIYKGVDLNLFNPKQRKNSQTIKILFSGNLTTAKGFDDLLVVFQRLRSIYKNIKLIVAGEGPYGKNLKVIKDVDFEGFLPYKELAEVYSTADICCAPSKEKRIFGIKVWEEYFSYGLMEAQAAGLPIVAAKTGGIPEEVYENNFIIQPGNKELLYKALEVLICNKNKRRELGELNRKRAEKLFDAKRHAIETENTICKLL